MHDHFRLKYKIKAGPTSASWFIYNYYPWILVCRGVKGKEQFEANSSGLVPPS